MLVLTRKQDQCVVVSEDIEIFILSVGVSRVRIGIKAPGEIDILRGELELMSSPQSAGGLTSMIEQGQTSET